MEIITALESLVRILVNPVLTALVLFSSVYLVVSLFNRLGRGQPESVKRVLTSALEDKRYQELVGQTIDDLQQEVSVLMGKLAKLELEKEMVSESKNIGEPSEGEEEKTDDNSSDTQIQDVRSTVIQLNQEIKQKQAEYRSAARMYAETIVGDLDSRTLLSQDGQSNLVLEYTTVIIILAAVLMLALLGILTGDQLTPILASIAGYVLGRSSIGEKQK